MVEKGQGHFSAVVVRFSPGGVCGQAGAQRPGRRSQLPSHLLPLRRTSPEFWAASVCPLSPWPALRQGPSSLSCSFLICKMTQSREGGFC